MQEATIHWIPCVQGKSGTTGKGQAEWTGTQTAEAQVTQNISSIVPQSE